FKEVVVSLLKLMLMMRRKNTMEHKICNIIMVKHGGGNGSHDDVTADRSSRNIGDVCWGILSDQIQPNAAKLLGQCFTVQMDNHPDYSSDINRTEDVGFLLATLPKHLT
uniref:Uncharacterized protein n=1 Tax=Oreochromis aureus TaxID=47969 RepID=A0AAZ1WX58_OREAU